MIRPIRYRQIPRLVVALGVLPGLVSVGLSAAMASEVEAQHTDDTVKASVEQAVSEELADKGVADFWVVFEERADLGAAYAIEDWDERGQYVYDQLTTTASRSQAELVAELTSRGVEHEAFHIVNAVHVEGGDQATVELARSRPEVEAIVAPPTYTAPEPIEEPDSAMTPQAVEWGIANIRATEVWDTYGTRGEGIVIANIDTGVQFDHPALVGQYRGNNGDGTFTHDYNWFDATGSCPGAPCDSGQHGTHTMGTMVGDDGAGNQIGVAPGATWIAANGCCPSDDALVTSAQWMLAPTDLDNQNPDVSMRPHIINNSWGSEVPSNDPFMEDILIAWEASGIFGMWSNGNNGPSCSTSGSPGSRIINYSAGAYDVDNQIAGFSSRGPGQDGEIKPNIAAPGVDVRSSVPGDEYANASGTSMAAPHTAGAIALVWSSSPALIGNTAATKALLDDTARDVDDTTCGGTVDDNNVYGEGRLDAFAAVDQAPRGPAGTLTGTVTDTVSDAGRGGVTVTAVGDNTLRTTTRSDGTYELRLPVGTYEVSADALGYYAEPAPGVEIVQDQTTTRNFALDPVPAMTTTADELRSWQHPGETVSKTLTLGNQGAADLDWQVDADGSACGTTGTPSWATVNPNTGRVPAGDEQQVTVEFDSSGVPEDQFEAGMCLIGNDPKQPVAVVSLSLAVDAALPETWVQRDRLSHNDPADGLHSFGWRVDVDGDTAVVLACGQPASSSPDDASGAALVYTRTADGVWREQAQLLPSIPEGTCVREGGFGFAGAVAVDGDTVLLGLPLGGVNNTMGTVTVFTRSGGEWTEQTQLSGVGYGFAVDLVGDTLFTSASPDSWATVNHHVYHREGSAWSKQAELALPEGATAPFDLSMHIAVDGDTAVVTGVRFADTPAGGWRAAVFTRTGADWTFEAELAPSDGALGLSFARHGVSIDGETVVVTASRPDGGDPATRSAVYVFQRGADGWRQQAKLTQPSPDGAWRAVAVDGEQVAIGEEGFGVRLWDRVGDGWRQHATLVPAGQSPGGEVGDLFGQSVSLDGAALVTSTLPTSGNGEAYVYDTNEPSPTVHLAPRAAEFGGVPVGAVSDRRTVTVDNNGSADLRIDALSLTGEHPADFELTDDDCSDRAIAPNASCTYAVSFTPGAQSLGERTARIEMPSNAATAPDPVTVTGEGLPAPPAIDVLPKRLVVEAPEGSRTTEPLAISNRGTTGLDWSVFPDPGSTETLSLRPVRKTTEVPVSPVDLDRIDTGRLTTGSAGGTLATPSQESAPTSATPGTVTVSHSQTMDILRPNTVRCGYDDLTTAGNRFLRVFTLADFGVGASMEITEVTFGVEELSVAADIQVNVYRLVGELTYANLDLLATETISLQPQSQTLVTVPIGPATRAPANSTVVLEIAAPDLEGVGSFVAGSNQDGESALSYLAAPSCELTEPTPYSRIDVADPHPVHLVMTMTGRVDCDESWLDVDPTSGTIAGDDAQFADVTLDTTDLAVGEHSTNICLTSNDPRRPLTSVPVALEVTEAEPVTFDDLRDRVLTFETDGDVTRVGAKRLLSAVDRAERHHDRGANDRAITVLESFQQIASDPKLVPSETASDALIAAADQLIDQLREPNSDGSAGLTASAPGLEAVPT